MKRADRWKKQGIELQKDVSHFCHLVCRTFDLSRDERVLFHELRPSKYIDNRQGSDKKCRTYRQWNGNVRVLFNIAHSVISLSINFECWRRKKRRPTQINPSSNITSLTMFSVPNVICRHRRGERDSFALLPCLVRGGRRQNWKHGPWAHALHARTSTMNRNDPRLATQ